MASFQLSKLDEISDEVNLLETELKNEREQPYERDSGDYDDGNLRRAVAHFIKTFSEFCKEIRDYRVSLPEME